jgi:hypothetical protein
LTSRLKAFLLVLIGVFSELIIGQQKANYFQEIDDLNISIAMVFVEGGKFNMGAEGQANEREPI